MRENKILIPLLLFALLFVGITGLALSPAFGAPTPGPTPSIVRETTPQLCSIDDNGATVCPTPVPTPPVCP